MGKIAANVYLPAPGVPPKIIEMIEALEME
jgi:hypothetical protein